MPTPVLLLVDPKTKNESKLGYTKIEIYKLRDKESNRQAAR